MNLNSKKCLVFASVLGLLGLSSLAIADNKDTIDIKLDGYQVVSSQSTPGSGRFRATVNRESQTIEYQLAYQNLEGDILQSHIHFGRPGTNGGIVTFLCKRPEIKNAPPTKECPDGREGMVTGTLQPSDVIYKPFPSQFPFELTGGTISQQLIEPGEFEELVKAIDAGAAYVVVHTEAQPTGELRGNIPGRRHNEH